MKEATTTGPAGCGMCRCAALAGPKTGAVHSAATMTASDDAPHRLQQRNGQRCICGSGVSTRQQQKGRFLYQDVYCKNSGALIQTTIAEPPKPGQTT